MKKLIIKLDTIVGNRISRSEAREVLLKADECSSIIMDYDNVATVGQAFADEIYRVFQELHPDIRLENENMSEGVRFMVERAKTEAKRK